MWYFNLLPPSTYCHPQYTTNWGKQVVALYCIILFMWWHKDELWLDDWKLTIWNTNYAHLQHNNQTEASSIYLYIAITKHNIYCCNFYLLLSHYFNPAVLINKVSVTKHQCAASFGIFVFKLLYVCNSINQRYSSHLNTWRDRVTSLKRGMVSQIQQKQIPFKIKTTHILCISFLLQNKTNKW